MRGICVKDWEAIALRDNCKTSIRRLVHVPASAEFLGFENGRFCFSGGISKKPLYQTGDVLFVRETWRAGAAHRFECDARIEFKAGRPNSIIRFPSREPTKNSDSFDDFVRKWPIGDGYWNGPITMPKEAARFFLRVNLVRLEHLQDISDEDCMSEGVRSWTKDGKLYKYFPVDTEGDYPACAWASCPRTPRDAMHRIWDKYLRSIAPGPWPDVTMRQYGWDANPWVQVVRFERISKEEVLACEA